MSNIFYKKKIKKKNLFLNFGPAHPAAHGVLRLLIELKGEYVIKIDPQIGLLHRASEKLMENKKYLSGLGFFDRFDYLSMLPNEHCLSLVFESLLNIRVPSRVQYIRIIFDEISRIGNHLLCLTTQAIDCGAISPFLLVGCELRELIMEYYERLSGARMHAFFFRPGSFSMDLPLNFLSDLFKFLKIIDRQLLWLTDLLSHNKIWKQRLKNIGIVSKKKAFDLSFSGVLLRSTNFPFDIRKLVYFKYNILE